jgi:hypothetical protein
MSSPGLMTRNFWDVMTASLLKNVTKPSGSFHLAKSKLPNSAWMVSQFCSLVESLVVLDFSINSSAAPTVRSSPTPRLSATLARPVTRSLQILFQSPVSQLAGKGYSPSINTNGLLSIFAQAKRGP